MRITLDLPEKLLEEAMRITNIQTKTQVIITALEELIRKSKNTELKKRFKRLLSAKKEIPVSYEEITKEVEKVRAARYK